MPGYRGARYLSYLEQQKAQEMMDAIRSRFETTYGELSPSLQAMIGGEMHRPVFGGPQELATLPSYIPEEHRHIWETGGEEGLVRHAQAAVAPETPLSEIINIPSALAFTGGRDATVQRATPLPMAPGGAVPLSLGQMMEMKDAIEAAQKAEPEFRQAQHHMRTAEGLALHSQLEEKQSKERAASKRKLWTYAISAIATLVSMGALGAVAGAIGGATAGTGVLGGATAGLTGGTLGMGGLGSTLISSGLGALGGGISGGWKGAAMGGLGGLAGGVLGKGLSQLLGGLGQAGLTPAQQVASQGLTNPALRAAAQGGVIGIPAAEALAGMGGYMVPQPLSMAAPGVGAQYLSQLPQMYGTAAPTALSKIMGYAGFLKPLAKTGYDIYGKEQKWEDYWAGIDKAITEGWGQQQQGY